MMPDIETGRPAVLGTSGAWGDKAADAPYRFAERTVRQGFVRKVFGLLSIQLLVTVAVIAVFNFHQPTRYYLLTHMWPFYTSLGASFALLLVLTCSDTARRRYPTNLIALFAFTACEAFLLGTIGAMYASQILFMAIGITACTVIALTVFAMQTKIDFTIAGGLLFSLLAAIIFATVVQVIFHLPWLRIIISVAGALLFSAYLVSDLQMLMGTQRYSISPDEYIFATLTLYLDVINLFLYILSLSEELSE